MFGLYLGVSSGRPIRVGGSAVPANAARFAAQPRPLMLGLRWLEVASRRTVIDGAAMPADVRRSAAEQPRRCWFGGHGLSFSRAALFAI
jgi:hypothetical protein